MNIKEMLAPINPTGARSGAKRVSFSGVTIHNTGNIGKGANALSHAKLLQGSGSTKQASWHYATDQNMSTQSIPENEKAWHARDGAYGKGNSNTIAIEICMNSDGDLLKATNNAAELAADILRRHGVTTAYGYLFQHNNWSGKDCPQMIRKGIPYDWNAFIKKVDDFLKSKPKEHSENYYKIQKLYGFNDETMAYLEAYKYKDALFIEMLENANTQQYQIITINYILGYKYGKEVFAKLAS